MAVNRLDNAKGQAEAGRAPEKNGAAAANGAAETAKPQEASGGGIKAWLPLILNLVLMPVVAYCLTTFVLIPKLKGAAKSTSAEHVEEADSHGAKAESTGAHDSGGHDEKGRKTKITVPLSGKTLVNVAGTMGTRYLMASITLVGTSPNLKTAVEKSDAELRDAAASTLSNKTISDLEKPGIRNLVRTELIAVFNSILGKGMVSEIYLTEFAIQ
ncbi:MAG: flagellar basal body-associated FliL family protein [Verrucomicrobiota bacterium]|nr:flagellar basal body-associated FliL family protein [Verrucomicrobiota bacterium]